MRVRGRVRDSGLLPVSARARVRLRLRVRDSRPRLLLVRLLLLGALEPVLLLLRLQAQSVVWAYEARRLTGAPALVGLLP